MSRVAGVEQQQLLLQRRLFGMPALQLLSEKANRRSAQSLTMAEESKEHWLAMTTSSTMPRRPISD
jgi:hypothetical protein